MVKEVTRWEDSSGRLWETREEAEYEEAAMCKRFGKCPCDFATDEEYYEWVLAEADRRSKRWIFWLIAGFGLGYYFLLGCVILLGKL